MRIFEKPHKLDNVRYDVRGPVLDEANRMEQAGETILKLNIGNPAVFGVMGPDNVVEYMKSQLDKCEAYSESKGILPAREAIRDYALSKGFINVSTDDIFIGNGASELISMALQGILDYGDEMLIPAPDYPLWTASANLAGGRAVHYLCDEQSDWMPDLADMEAKITDRTRGIVIINPNNPTGALYSRDVLERVVDICRRHSLILLCDEIYDRLLMDGVEHISAASLADDIPVITFNGLSKSHRLCGYRVGWMVVSGDKSGMQQILEGFNMLASMRLCANVPSQSIIPLALEDAKTTDPLYLPGGRIFEQRNLIVDAVNDIPGMHVVKPKAGLYCFPGMDSRYNITNDEKFCFDFLHEKKVLFVPGSGFNWPHPGYFRIVYLANVDELQMAADRLRDFLSTYRQ